LENLIIYCDSCDTSCIIRIEEPADVIYCPFCGGNEIEIMVDDGIEDYNYQEWE
jgi:Zn finger protein HypA/HybF involved in hydrogenase expression